MAINLPPYVPFNPVAQFDSIATRIYHTFDPLIVQLTSRRNALLLKVSQLREDYTTKETTRRAAIEEIEKAQEQMQLLSLKVNINLPIHQQASDVYKQGLNQLETPTKLPCLQFQCQTLHKLESLIAEFGGVVEWEVPDYTLKNEPVLTAGKFGTDLNEFIAAGLTIDESNRLIYIANWLNSRIQIVSYRGDIVDKFGQDELKEPFGVALTNEHVYVTDIGLHALLQFDKNSFELVSKTGTEGQIEGQFIEPSGICIDYSGDVFVADCGNNRVCVFFSDLQFKYNLGIGQLKCPVDVKLTPDCVVVILDKSQKCVHYFSRNGHLLHSCVPRGEGPDCLVDNPSFLCLDPAGNIIISDWGNHSIKIISKYDQLIHTIGRKGNEKGELVNPYGISISNSGIIFIVSCNANFSFQCF